MCRKAAGCDDAILLQTLPLSKIKHLQCSEGQFEYLPRNSTKILKDFTENRDFCAKNFPLANQRACCILPSFWSTWMEQVRRMMPRTELLRRAREPEVRRPYTSLLPSRRRLVELPATFCMYFNRLFTAMRKGTRDTFHFPGFCLLAGMVNVISKILKRYHWEQGLFCIVRSVLLHIRCPLGYQSLQLSESPPPPLGERERDPSSLQKANVNICWSANSFGG